MSLPPHRYVNTPEGWRDCLEQLRRVNQLALDLESNSMYAYEEEVCLIQISTRQTDFIVDPLAPLDLSELGPIIEDPAVEKVFHAAEYDLILMRRQFGWRLRNLFDTMWAVRILGYDRVGLANVLEDTFGVTLDKRFQRSNWCARPLSDEQLAYAQSDTHYLLELADRLAAALKERGRWDEAMEIFAEQSNVTLPDTSFDPDSFWSIHGVQKLPASGKATLRALNIFREEEAQRRNKPPFKIFGKKTLLSIASAMPRSLDELSKLPGMSHGQVRRYGRRLLDVVAQNRGNPAPRRRPSSGRPPDDVYLRFEALHNWRKRRARQRGVESDVIISRDSLWMLARENPQTLEELEAIAGLGPVRRDMYGEEILRVLQGR